MDDSAPGRLLAEIRRASQQLRGGRRADAILIYGEVRDKAGSIPQVQFELGNLCQEIGDVDQAIAHYVVAAREAPDNPVYASVLGIAYLNAHELDNARATLERALAINPDIPEVQHGLGVYYMRCGDHAQAIAYLERASELKPGDASIRTNLAQSLIHVERHEEALVHARKAVKLDESSAGAHIALCNVLTETGQMGEARQHLEKTIRRHPAFGQAYDLLARIRKFSAADDAFIRKAEKALELGMPPTERYCLHYALGKINDDCQRFDEAFAHYEQANLLQKREFDPGQDAGLAKDLQKAFTAASLKARAGTGHPSAKPVFIVGMPRSGTTLMERIIAAHPLGAGAGELPDLPRIANQLFPQNARQKGARGKPDLSPDSLLAHAQTYLAALERGRPDAERIVDKMPSNFYFVGLIKTLFPNAAVINAMRHPLDSCLSCYFQSFAELRWANDLRHIGRVYALYRKCMAYWHEVLPPGSILDIRYEALVDDPETHARQMLEFCGLEWDPGVLDFFQEKGVVRTASIAQARMPIYKTSKARWMNYARHLGPLAEELAPWLDDDRALLAEHGLELPSGRGWLGKLFR